MFKHRYIVRYEEEGTRWKVFNTFEEAETYARFLIDYYVDYAEIYDTETDEITYYEA